MKFHVEVLSVENGFLVKGTSQPGNGICGDPNEFWKIAGSPEELSDIIFEMADKVASAKDESEK